LDVSTAVARRRTWSASEASPRRRDSTPRVPRRRSLRTWSVVSTTAVKTPPTSPESTVIGLYEKVKYVSSR
jgi:hypothetical protein